MDWLMILLLGAFAASFLGLGWCVFMFQRNEWVYRERTRLIHSEYNRYEQLPTYRQMLWKFWVWDVGKFLPSKFK